MVTDKQLDALDTRSMTEAKRITDLLRDKMRYYNTILYIAKDLSQLDLLVSRLPAEVSQRPRMTFDEFLVLLEQTKPPVDIKGVLVTHEMDPTSRNLHGLPSAMLFLPNSVIAEVEGRFNELRDQTGCKWGDFEKRILTTHVLNPEHTP